LLRVDVGASACARHPGRATWARRCSPSPPWAWTGGHGAR